MRQRVLHTVLKGKKISSRIVGLLTSYETNVLTKTDLLQRTRVDCYKSWSLGRGCISREEVKCLHYGMVAASFTV